MAYSDGNYWNPANRAVIFANADADADKNMSSAIAHYNRLKVEMCKSLAAITKTVNAGDMFLTNFNAQMNAYRAQGKADTFNIMKSTSLRTIFTFLDKKAQWYVNHKKGDSNWASEWNAAFGNLRNDYSEKLRELAKTQGKITERLNSEIEKQGLLDYVKRNLIKRSDYVNQDSTALFDLLQGYMRRAVLYYMSGLNTNGTPTFSKIQGFEQSDYLGTMSTSNSYRHYIETIMGYLQEGALCDAAIKAGTPLFGNLVTYRISGADRNAKGVMGKEDLIISFPKTCSVTGKMVSNIGSVGIQSKSWSISSADFAKLAQVKGSTNITQYHISNTAAAGFRQALTGTPAEFWWHAGLAIASAHMTEILGEKNALYANRAEIFWTSDFLIQLKKINWVVAYSMTARRNRNSYEGRKQHDKVRKVSESVYFRPHDDSGT